MPASCHHVAAACFLIPSIVIGGCGKAPPKVAPPPRPVEAHLTMSAAADLNPDAAGRPSPVVLRLYQLKGDAAFAGADFFGLFDDEQQALGAELISRAEFILAPSEQRTVDLAVDGDARFVGALAAFRDIRNAQWRVLVPTWPEGARQLTVTVGRAGIVATIADADQQDQ
jgi:type VI secretion system protein VasD